MATFDPNKPSLLQMGKGAAKAATRAGPASGLLASYEAADMLNSAFNPVTRMEAIRQGKDQFDMEQLAKNNPQAVQEAPGKMQATTDRAVAQGLLAAKQGAEKYPEYAAKGAYPVDLKAIQQKAAATPPAAVGAQVTAQQDEHPMAKQLESQRQVVEAGAKEQLRTNSLSRPKAAVAVVQADMKATGQQLTPTEMKTRVAEETAAMKSMDDDQLSKYLSYALIGAGLIASAYSKEAGQAFVSSMNQQLDRNLTREQMQAKQKAAEAAAAYQASKDERTFGLKERELTGTEAKNAADLENTKADNAREDRKMEGLLDKWERDAANADAKTAAYRERTLKTGSGASGAGKGPNLSFKDNKELVTSYLKSKGIEPGTGVVETAAQQLQNIQKAYPDFTAKEQMEMIEDQFEGTPAEGKTFGFIPFTGKQAGLKLKDAK